GVTLVVDKRSVKIISLISELGEDEAKILYLPKIDSIISDVAIKAWVFGIFSPLILANFGSNPSLFFFQ
ncbi:MAG: hypothetical protein QNJ72_40015, partial [Pleurocapsa sp. MO_226.B13]|nr:hypothetical protein [Pleurocapsa sp. MO_226.B13]